MKRYEERKQELLNATERLKEAILEKESDIVDEFAKNAVDAFPEVKKYVDYIKNKK